MGLISSSLRENQAKEMCEHVLDKACGEVNGV